jgi:hypothetical protein
MMSKPSPLKITLLALALSVSGCCCPEQIRLPGSNGHYTLVGQTKAGQMLRDEIVSPSGGITSKTPGAILLVGDNGVADYSKGRDGGAIGGRDSTVNGGTYGLAYALSGTAKAGAQGIVATRNGGSATTGDGGVAVGLRGGSASVEGDGIAFIRNSRGSFSGRVKSTRTGSLLVIGYDPPIGRLKLRAAMVGTTVDGTKIEPGKYYQLDSNKKFILATNQTP